MTAAGKDVRTRIAEALPRSMLAEALAARDQFNAQAAQLREAAGVTVDDDEDQWRRLSGDSKRDLAPLTHQRMQELALYLWESNLLANRLIELPLAYLLAEGVRIEAVDEIVQEWIDRFWRDPINVMDLKLIKKARELALYGEQCWPTFVNEYSGHVRLGYLDPALIATVVLDPDNGEQPIGVVTRRDDRGRVRRYRVIVNGPEAELFTRRTQEIRNTFADGECFYFKVNDLSNSSRGRSDLLPQIDWLDAYDQFLFGELDRTGFLRAFIWDVTLKGATPDQVKEKAKQIATPSPGSVRVHNDSEVWTAESPELGAYEAAAGARLFRNHVLGGATVPEHWFGGGGDVNRAAAAEMGDPTFKMFAMRQRLLGYILLEVARYQIRQRELANGSGEPDLSDPIYALSVQWPEMVARDISKYAAALQQVTAAGALMIVNELVSKERVVQIIEKISARLGVEFDVAEELGAAVADAAKRKEDDVFPPLPGTKNPPPDDGTAAGE